MPLPDLRTRGSALACGTVPQVVRVDGGASGRGDDDERSSLERRGPVPAGVESATVTDPSSAKSSSSVSGCYSHGPAPAPLAEDGEVAMVERDELVEGKFRIIVSDVDWAMSIHDDTIVGHRLSPTGRGDRLLSTWSTGTSRFRTCTVRRRVGPRPSSTRPPLGSRRAAVRDRRRRRGGGSAGRGGVATRTGMDIDVDEGRRPVDQLDQEPGLLAAPRTAASMAVRQGPCGRRERPGAQHLVPVQHQAAPADDQPEAITFTGLTCSSSGSSPSRSMAARNCSIQASSRSSTGRRARPGNHPVPSRCHSRPPCETGGGRGRRR